MRTRKREEINAKKVVAITSSGSRKKKKTESEMIADAVEAIHKNIETLSKKQPEVTITPTIKVDMPEPAKSFEVTVTERRDGKIHKVRIDRVR